MNQSKFHILFCLCWFGLLISCVDKKESYQPKKSNPRIINPENEIRVPNTAPDPNYLVTLLDNSDDLESEKIGWEGRASPSYLIFEELCAIASDTTLIRLTKHPNPKIRVYGMWALTDRNPPLALTQMRLLRNDNATVVYQSGCTTMEEKACWLMARRFDSAVVELIPKNNLPYLDYEVEIK